MIISRYLTREVFNALLAVTIILLLAFLSQQIVRYLNYVAMGKIPTNVLLELVGFEVPYLLALLLPLGLYLAILLAYGRLYTENEMAIIQMYGYSHWHITRLTSVIALGVTILVLYLMLWVNPVISAKRQQVMESDQATVHLVQTLIPGRFQSTPDGRQVMYVEKLSRDHQRAENVFIARQSEQSADDQSTHAERPPPWTLILADQGYQIKDPTTQDQFFVTTDGYRYEGVPGQNDYTITQFKKYAVRIPQSDVRITHQENESLSTWQLIRDYQEPKRAAELQWRFSIAISTFLLALLAVPSSKVRPRQGRYLMLLPGILVYISYIYLLFMARRWVEQGLMPIMIGMWWVHVVVLGLVISVFWLKQRTV